MQQSIKSSLLISAGKIDDSKDGSDEVEFSTLLETILKGQAIKVSSETLSYDAYSYFVPTEDPSYIVNAIFSVENDELTGGYLQVFRMTSEFASAFNSFSIEFNEFEGELGILPLASLKELLYEPGEKNGDGDCFTYSLSLTPVTPSGGSGGPGGIVVGPGPGSTTQGGNPGGSFICIEVYQEERACECSREGGICCHSDNDRTILIRVDCITIQTLSDGSTTTSNNKDISIEDCTPLLSSIGIVPRSLSTPDASMKVLEQISAAIGQTCFDENAVMDMIDPGAFEACYAAGTAPASCITDQVIIYLENLDCPPVLIPGTPIDINGNIIFNNLPHDQLAIFLHAAVTANGNEHVLAGICFARRNILNPYVANSLPSVIVQASILNLTDSVSFGVNSSAYISVLNKTKGHLSREHTTWLMRNPDVLTRIDDLDILDETVQDLTETYISLYENDVDFKVLADSEFETIPPIVWFLIREIGAEVAIELIKRNVPGVSDYSNVIDAINNVRQGDLLGFLGEVLDIVKRKFPVLAPLNLALDSIELGGKAGRAIRAVKRLERFGETAITKLLEVVGDRAGSLLGKIVYTNNRTGIKLNDVGIPLEFRDKLISKLREAVSIDGPIAEGPNVKFIVERNTPQEFDIIWQPTSSTTGGPSLNFRKDGFVVKLRF